MSTIDFPVRAAFFDLDGTLLSHVSHEIPLSARDSLEKLRAKGIKIYLCTGRHSTELTYLPVEGIPFDGYITLNGHLCLDENKNLVFGLPFPEDTTRALISIFKEQKLPLVLVEENGLTLSFANDTPYDGKPIYQATTFADRSEDERLHAMMPPNCHTARWNDQGVDLILNGGGKVAGIRYVLGQAGISPDECIAFGDAENDIDMLSFVGIGVAMGNAQAKVKEISNYVTSDVDDDGIEKALRYWRII